MHELRIPVPSELAADTPTLHFRVRGLKTPPAATPDLALACHLIPAMRVGTTLAVPGKPRVDVAGIRDRLSAWYPALAPMRLSVSPNREIPQPEGRRTAAFFTGGADSFYTLDSHYDEIDALIYVLGFDVRPDQSDLWSATRRMLDDVAHACEKDLILVETNLRPYLDRHAVWEETHGTALAAVSHLLAHEFHRILIASTIADEQAVVWGSHQDLDPLWSTPTLSVEHDGGSTTRLEKLRALGSNELALRHLRVCWENPGQAYNCGKCSKCIRTRLALDSLGLIERCASFSGVTPTAREVRRLKGGSRLEAHFVTEVADEYDRRRVNSPASNALRRWLHRNWGREATVGERLLPTPSGRRDSMVVGEPHVEVDEEETRLTVPVRRGADRAVFELRMPLGGIHPPRVGDALLLWFVLPAMRTASALKVQAPVSAELLERVGRAQRVWANLPEYRGHLPVPIDAPVREPAAHIDPADPTRPWCSAFSGGVDSFHAALRNRERIAFLVTIHGILQEEVDPEDLAITSAWLRAGAEAVGLPLVEVVTNLRQVLVGRMGCRWDYTFILAKYGLAHFLFPHIGGMLIGGELDYRELQSLHPTTKYNPLFDPLTSSDDVRVRIDGMTLNRLQKTRELSGHPRMVDALWVCHQRYASDYKDGRNCGRCEKCIRTLTALRLLGVEDGQRAFDRPFHLKALRRVRIPEGVVSPSTRTFYRQMLGAAREAGDQREIAAALERVVARFPPGLQAASETADAMVARFPILSATTAALRRTVGRRRWNG